MASTFQIKVRSMVGLIPLFAVETLDSGLLHRLSGFKRRMEWFIDNRPDLTKNVASITGRPEWRNDGCSRLWILSSCAEC